MGTINVTLGEDTQLNLILGQQLENAVTAVVFDFSAWQTEFGSGTLGLSVQRHGDTQPYAVVPTVSGTNATWNISELDTAYKGVGEVQVTYTVGSVVKKSTVYKFTVYRSLGENGEYPSPGQTWQKEIEDELADVKQELSYDSNTYNDEISAISGIEHIPSENWEIGGIAFTNSQPTFAANLRRARTKQTFTSLSLHVGDKIGLESYASNKFAFYGKKSDNSWFYSGDTFLTSDYTVLEELTNCYVVVIKSGTESNISEPYTFGSLLRVIRASSDLFEIKTKLNNISTVTRNLFNKDAVSIINGYIASNGDVSSSSYGRIAYMPIQVSTTYTISKVQSARFRTCFTKVVPSIGTPGYNVSNNNYTDTSITTTSPSDALYLCIWFYQSNSDTLTMQQILDTIQVEKGSEATPYTNHYTSEDLIARSEIETINSKLSAVIYEHWIVSDSIDAYLTSDGTLSVIGTGTMPTYSNSSRAPWCSIEYLSQIKDIYIDPRVYVGNIAYWFYDVNGQCSTVERFNVYGNVNEFPANAFTGLNIHHINLGYYARYRNTDHTVFMPFIGSLDGGATGSGLFYPHSVISIPKVLVEDNTYTDFLTTVYTAIFNQFYDASYATCLVITDSDDLRDTIISARNAAHEDSGVNRTQFTNLSVIYCDELGVDGFPTYWTAAMKRVFPEIIPYIGKDMTTVRYSEGGYAVDGMSALGHYSRLGTPNLYDMELMPDSEDVDIKTRLYVNNYDPEYETERGTSGITGYIRAADVEPSFYQGQPYTTSLESLSAGVTCNGFVCFIYWRYFLEHFAFASTEQFCLTHTNSYGAALPIVEIQESELSPFDMIGYYNSSNGNGHIAIYIGDDGNGGHLCVDAASSRGLTFSSWHNDPSTEPAQTKFLRLNKTGLSKGLLRQKPTT